MDIDIPGYTLLRTLGKGGMATVYLASQDVLERRVALKVMSRNLAEDSAFGARFMREAKIVSQLVHPNIVTVHEVGQHDGRYFLSMEYIDGHDLRTVRKNLDLAGKLKVIEDIARALHYAGEKGYVHRDIKPENIMFREAEGSAVLTDFGIAKAVENDLTMTQTGTAIGTPHYMSPEQAKGKDVDHRSDLYSLGVVFYLLLVGRVPYDADTAIAIGIKHLTEDVPLLPQQFASMQYVIDGLMAKNRDDRYQSGLHLLNDLRLIDLDRITDEIFIADDQPTISADVPTSFGEAPTGIGAGGIGSAKSDSKRFTIEFGIVEPSTEQPPRAILPALFASLFVVFAIAVFVYFARPAVLEKQIAYLEGEASRAYAWLSGYAQEGVTVAEGALDGVQREYDEISASVGKTLSTEDTDSGGASGVDGAVESGSDGDGVNSVKGDISRPDSTPVAEIQGLSNGVTEQDGTEQGSTQQDETALPEVEIPVLDDLLKTLTMIQEQGATGQNVLLDEVLAHRDVLVHYPDHQPTIDSLLRLQEQQQNDLVELSKKGDKARVAQGFEKLKVVFASELSEVEIERLSSELNQNVAIFELLERAETQRKNKQLARPDGDNAIDSLIAVLALDAQNQLAIDRLNQFSESFYRDAKKAFQERKLESAKDANNIALKANAQYRPAQDLAQSIAVYEEQQRQLAAALNDAKRYAELGYLYTPEGANAYDAFARALEIDPSNELAESGLAGLLDQLSVQVWALVGDAEFEQAKAKLERPLALMPENERILAIQAAVNDVAEGN